MLNSFKINGLNLRKRSTQVYIVRNPLVVLNKVSIKIIGKVFRWIFKKNRFKFSINTSHTNNLFVKNLFVILKNGKYSVNLIVLNNLRINRFLKYLNKINKVNVFTSRGLLTDRHVLVKKIGKISTYI